MSALGRGKKMEKKFGLSETEYELMEFFWESNRKLSFREILDYFNEIKKKELEKTDVKFFFDNFTKKKDILKQVCPEKSIFIILQEQNKSILKYG